ncbi:MAG: hypothetical protein IAF02_16215 [Anaerolineae bacterium]|nr:hypothetical protein [Anaerolineae bacterium]
MKPFRSISIAVSMTFLALIGLVFLLMAVPGQAETSAVTFKDQDGVPITGIVRVLCFDGLTAVSPRSDLNIQVNAGTPFEPLPVNCTHLVALRLRHTQPSGKHDQPAYWNYTTSWTPGATTPQPASGDIILSDLQPLTLINMVVSLSWTPAPNSTVATAAEIRDAMQAVSQELYDLTDGQMALGPVSISTGGDRWAEADIRFLPANDKRPSAFVGGIVPDKLNYTGYLTNTTYTPAATYFGRLWDGRDAFDEENGRWTTPNAYRTITHEWSHYGLFLYDEYQDTTGGPGYCICETLPSGCGFGDRDGSAMAYHYTATEFWHKDTHFSGTNLSFCQATWQHHVHGRTDWDFLAFDWANLQGLPLSFVPLRSPVPQLDSGPTMGLTAHLFGAQPGHDLFLPVVVRDGETAVSPQEPIINVLLDTTTPPTTTQPTQLYLLQGGSDTPSRILPQGRVTGDPAGNSLGKLRLLDVNTGDTIRAFADWHGLSATAGTRYTLYTDEDPTNDITLLENPAQFSLDHHFDLVENQVMTLTIALEERSGSMSLPKIQLCSLDAAIGCHPAWAQTMSATGSGAWQAQFTPLAGQKELPRYLVMRIVDGHDLAVADELVQWLQVGGGVGPAHNDGMAPLLDDVIMVNVAQPLAQAGDCNVVSYMPATNADALKAALPPGFGGLIGIPLDIDITLTDSQCPTWFPHQDQPLPQNINVLLNFGYSQDEATRLGIDTLPEEFLQLKLLHFNSGGSWSTTQQITTNTDLNWVTATISEDGIYAIGWQP